MTLHRMGSGLDFNMNSPIDLQAVRELAYQLWVARGKRDGHAHEDWLEAERQILAKNPVSKRAQKRARAAASVKTPTVPMDEGTSSPPEMPKVGSRDAPGG